MTINENAVPEELVCDCGSTLRRNPGRGWACDECGRSCSISGRVSIRNPEPYRERENLKPLSQGEFDHLFPIEIDWAAVEDTFLKGWTYREALRELALWDRFYGPGGPFDLPGNNGRDDEVS